MRRSRLGRHAGSEFPSSGEDSFVAVVVTKLTGALLFLLLLVMVIMALLPRAADLPTGPGAGPREAAPLAVATPEVLPEAIAGRPYTVALAATGAVGPLRWAVDGVLPEGLRIDQELGLIQGTPEAGTPEPVELVVRVSDGSDHAARMSRLMVYQPDGPLRAASRWAPGLPPIPWRLWLEQGFGFLVLLLVHMVGMNTLGSLERRSAPRDGGGDRRFTLYRGLVRLATLGSLIGLAAWLWASGAA